jgi:proline iminopeptidase
VGRYDEASPSAAAYYQSNLPGAKLRIFEDASHLDFIEKQPEYLQTVRELLRVNDSAQ